jgi:tetratricopeptide (TPR) repeat protein
MYSIERKAYVYEKNGDLSSAMDAWVQISWMLIDDWWPHYQIASLCEQLGEFERAITIWENLMVQNSQQGLHNLMVKRLERAYSVGRGPGPSSRDRGMEGVDIGEPKQ